jgi:Family of unknown function (DUF6348)
MRWPTQSQGVTGWGAGDAANNLQRWVLANPLLPRLTSLPAVFDRPTLNGVRIFFGGTTSQDTAEVRVNGRIDPDVTRQLHALTWPRTKEIGYVSTYVLAVHPG